MEELFEKRITKKGKVKYISVGYQIPDLQEGIWLVMKNPYSKSTTSLIYKIGEIPKANLQLHALMTKYQDEIALYLSNLQDSKSEEYKDAKELLGGWLHDSPEILNISMADLTTLILRKFANLIQEENENI